MLENKKYSLSWMKMSDNHNYRKYYEYYQWCLAKYKLSKSLYKGKSCIIWRTLYHVLEVGKNKIWIKKEKNILFEWGNNKNAKLSNF